MIITPQDVDPSLASDQKNPPVSPNTIHVTRTHAEPIPPLIRSDSDSHDPPPAYESGPSAPPPSHTTPSFSPQSSLPPQYKPTNFLYVRKLNGSIKETYVINPSMEIPPALLPALGTGETEADRKNLHLESYNGSISLEVHLLNPDATIGAAKPAPRARMAVSSKNGSVAVKVTSPHQAPSRPPFTLSAGSFNGQIKLQIPRDFHGPLKLSTFNGSVHLTDAVRAQSTDFGDVGGARVCFLGDFSGFNGTDKASWQGDEITAETKNGSIRVSFADETNASCSQSKSIFSRILGF